MTPKLIVFDCDGTLVNSLARVTNALRAGWKAVGLEGPDPGQARQMIGLPLETAIEKLLDKNLHSKVPDIASAYRAHYDAARSDEDTEQFFDGIRELLDWCRPTPAILGIATGKIRKGLDGVLHHHGIQDYFVTLQTGDQGPGKPHPAMLERAMKETGIDPVNTVMIGDTSYDMQMAKAAGTRAVGVAWGYHEPDILLETGAETVVNNSAELQNWLQDFLEAA